MVRAYLFFVMVAFGISAFAGQFDACLNQVKKTEHRLARLESVQSCFEKSKDVITADTCFSAIKKIQTHEKSIALGEKLNSICFYDVSRFKTVEACTQKISIFQIANNHDDALFDCYRQFQANMSQKECLKISTMMKYPAKKEYLENHCYENGVP